MTTATRDTHGSTCKLICACSIGSTRELICACKLPHACYLFSDKPVFYECIQMCKTGHKQKGCLPFNQGY